MGFETVNLSFFFFFFLKKAGFIMKNQKINFTHFMYERISQTTGFLNKFLNECLYRETFKHKFSNGFKQ